MGGSTRLPVSSGFPSNAPCLQSCRKGYQRERGLMTEKPVPRLYNCNNPGRNKRVAKFKDHRELQKAPTCNRKFQSLQFGILPDPIDWMLMLPFERGGRTAFRHYADQSCVRAKIRRS